LHALTLPDDVKADLENEYQSGESIRASLLSRIDLICQTLVLHEKGFEARKAREQAEERAAQAQQETARQQAENEALKQIIAALKAQQTSSSSSSSSQATTRVTQAPHQAFFGANDEGVSTDSSAVAAAADKAASQPRPTP